MSALVSVVIPTYNRANLISGAIESVLSQTYNNWELIVVDDRSIDNTKEIVKKYIAKDSRIKYVVNKHKKGPAGARNQGVELAKGDYIAFLDSDDIWKPWHLEEGLYYLNKYPQVDWLYADCEIVKNNEIIIESVLREKWTGRIFFTSAKLEDNFYLLKRKNFIINFLKYGSYSGLQSSIIRRHVFDNVRFSEDLIIGEDRFFVLSFYFAGYTLAYLLKCHVTYRLHSQQLSNASKNSFDKYINNVFELLNFYHLAYKSFKFSFKEKLEFRRKISDIYLWQVAYPFWQHGYKKESLFYFWKAFFCYPFRSNYLKQFCKIYKFLGDNLCHK